MLQLRSEDWRRRAEPVFLAGYRAAIGDCPSFPRNEASFSQLIEFVLEKTLYKICYEAANRPDWIHTPLAGIVEIFSHGKGTAATSGPRSRGGDCRG